MDLATLAIDPNNQTANMEVLHPVTGKPLTDEEGNKVTLTLHGPDSNAQRDVVHRFRNQALSERISSRGPKADISIEQYEAQALELDIAATASWENLAFEGEELECAPDNVRRVYQSLPWLREQVEAFIADRRNFL